MKSKIKPYIFILLTAMAGCRTFHQSKANDHGNLITSVYNNDTTRYIQREILDKKVNYLNKPLSFLVSNIEIPVKSYANSYVSTNIRIAPSIYLFFYNTNDRRVKMHNNVEIADVLVIWETPLNADSTRALIKKSHSEWTKEAYNFYADHIVKDILITRYRKREGQ